MSPRCSARRDDAPARRTRRRPCDQPSMEQAVARSGARPQIVFRTAVNDTLLSMVRAGLGSAMLPWLAIRGADVASDDRLRVHELLPPREIYLHWRAGRTHSPLARRAIEIAIEVAAGLAPPPPERAGAR
ncbi:LysR family transcriptional regulator substrate-binding protein [Nonomuraea sp. GTA35]|uniref:LysR family transcriptional regulator substrate-binding protein n=1 Tax=Nonomuraea sp. GTA35 TaxID=1676746 RepID=UPI0035BFCF2E